MRFAKYRLNLIAIYISTNFCLFCVVVSDGIKSVTPISLNAQTCGTFNGAVRIAGCSSLKITGKLLLEIANYITYISSMCIGILVKQMLGLHNSSSPALL